MTANILDGDLDMRTQVRRRGWCTCLLRFERKGNRKDDEAVNCVDLSSLRASGGRISRTRQSREEGDFRHSHRRSRMTSYSTFGASRACQRA